MAEDLGHAQLLEWIAYYLNEATLQDPEPTMWDDPVTAQRKLDRIAARNNRR